MYLLSQQILADVKEKRNHFLASQSIQFCHYLDGVGGEPHLAIPLNKFPNIIEKVAIEEEWSLHLA